MTTAQKTDKERALEILEAQPADASYDEIIHELAFERMIERGLADAEAGRTISSQEMKRRIDSWAK